MGGLMIGLFGCGYVAFICAGVRQAQREMKAKVVRRNERRRHY